MLSYLISLMEDSELVSLKDFALHLQLLKWVNVVQRPGLIIPESMTGTPIKVPS